MRAHRQPQMPKWLYILAIVCVCLLPASTPTDSSWECPPGVECVKLDMVCPPSVDCEVYVIHNITLTVDTALCRCPVGTYCVATECVACPEQTLCSADGNRTVPQLIYNPNTQDTCAVPRAGGTCLNAVLNPQTGSCDVCLPGFFSNGTSTSPCTHCPAGTYKSSYGAATACSQCMEVKPLLSAL